MFAAAGCTLTIEVPDEPVSGTWDGRRVMQLVRNLLSNAAKFGAGKPVTLALSRQGEQVMITVTDHGIGVKPEDRQRIFARFGRVVSRQHYSGLGLGLWVCHQIAEAHGGAIDVKSTPNERTTFTVVLPSALDE